MRGVGATVGLAAIWVLLWGSASLANVVTGLALGALLVVAVPGLGRSGRGRRLRPLAIVRLAVYVLANVVTSNLLLIREIVVPSGRLRTAVIGVPLPHCTPEVLTLVNNLVALAPGTMPIETTERPPMLYVHVLHLRELETTRRDITHLTDLVVAAFGP